MLYFLINKIDSDNAINRKEENFKTRLNVTYTQPN